MIVSVSYLVKWAIDYLAGLSGRENGFMDVKGLCVKGGVSNKPLTTEEPARVLGPLSESLKELPTVLDSYPRTPLRDAACQSWVCPESSGHVWPAR